MTTDKPLTLQEELELDNVLESAFTSCLETGLPVDESVALAVKAALSRYEMIVARHKRLVYVPQIQS